MWTGLKRYDETHFKDEFGQMISNHDLGEILNKNQKIIHNTQSAIFKSTRILKGTMASRTLPLTVKHV